MNAISGRIPRWMCSTMLARCATLGQYICKWASRVVSHSARYSLPPNVSCAPSVLWKIGHAFICCHRQVISELVWSEITILSTLCVHDLFVWALKSFSSWTRLTMMDSYHLLTTWGVLEVIAWVAVRGRFLSYFESGAEGINISSRRGTIGKHDIFIQVWYFYHRQVIFELMWSEITIVSTHPP